MELISSFRNCFFLTINNHFLTPFLDRHVSDVKSQGKYISQQISDFVILYQRERLTFQSGCSLQTEHFWLTVFSCGDSLKMGMNYITITKLKLDIPVLVVAAQRRLTYIVYTGSFWIRYIPFTRFLALTKLCWCYEMAYLESKRR
jgi:hypothetical protein